MSQIAPLPATDPVGSTPTSAKPPAAPEPPAPPVATPESNQRLVINESSELGVYVYTILDRTTGQVLMQLPRESADQLARQQDYSAGQVISTQA